jgi:phosphohistidine phosphatase
MTTELVSPNTLLGFPEVIIDKEGVFKYVQISVQPPASVSSIPLVFFRGHERCEYHADVFSMYEKALSVAGSVKCLGGGRISVEGTSVRVYGYSVGFGAADHSLCARAIKEQFPHFTVTHNNEGY